MATVTTALTPTPTIFPMQGIDDTVRDLSRVPRAEVFFSLDSEDVPVATGGDDSRINITCNLPVNFSYVVMEMNMKIDQASGTTWGWESRSSGFVLPGSVGNRDYNANFFSEGGDVSITDLQDVRVRRIFQFKDLPSMVILPKMGDQASIGCQIGSASVDNAASKVQFMCRLLQFDVTQAHHFQVNTPTPIR